jgi:hypothetical protein
VNKGPPAHGQDTSSIAPNMYSGIPTQVANVVQNVSDNVVIQTWSSGDTWTQGHQQQLFDSAVMYNFGGRVDFGRGRGWRGPRRGNRGVVRGSDRGSGAFGPRGVRGAYDADRAVSTRGSTSKRSRPSTASSASKRLRTDDLEDSDSSSGDTEKEERKAEGPEKADSKTAAT